MNLRDKIEVRKAVVSVVGLGYVGLPLAVVFAQAGYRVIGIDIDQQRVESINNGDSYIADVRPETISQLSTKAVSPGRSESMLSAGTDYDLLAGADVVIVCVDTPLGKTRDPDLAHIISATDDIANRLHRDMLVVLESTTYPGTTEELILPRLQAANGRPLKVGTDFFLAFSPERVDPGRSDWTILSTPKVIGGVTPKCLELARALYGSVVQELVPVSTPKVAEMVKLLENTFRATNIGMVNEIAMMCDRLEIDIWEVIEAASTKPFGFMPFYPGPGLGGHCLPSDPQYLAWKLRTLGYNARFIQLADEINLAMPLYWVTKVQDALNQIGKAVKGSSILVLGVTYKQDVGDTRESPGLDIIEQLLNRGANVEYHDPYVPFLKTDSYQLASITDASLEPSLADADCVLIVTSHSGYDWEVVRDRASVVVDTRNALGMSHSPDGSSSLEREPRLAKVSGSEGAS